VDSVTCDMCGKMLLEDEDTRYIVRIEVFAAYDTMELTTDQLGRDPSEEMARLLDLMERMDPQELEDQVYKAFRFDLCPACQRKYLKAPLGREPQDGDGGPEVG